MSRFASLTKRQKKNFDALVEHTVQSHCRGMQIPILDIPKVFEAARVAFDANHSVVEAIVSKYRELSQGGAA
jgi:hypothetical protein